MTLRGIQPSLRDLCNRQFEPGSELPGYSRISLRETEAAKMSKLHGFAFVTGAECFRPWRGVVNFVAPPLWSFRVSASLFISWQLAAYAREIPPAEWRDRSFENVPARTADPSKRAQRRVPEVPAGEGPVDQ